MKPLSLGTGGASGAGASRLEFWRGTGLGLRAGAVDPAWCARVDKPLLLLRRRGNDVIPEAFPFDTVTPRDGRLEAGAQVQDSAGARWEVRLAVRAREPDGFTGTLRWTLASGSAEGVFVGHQVRLLADPADLYVCLPGHVYDGNDISPRHKDIPRVSRTGVLEIPTTSLAAPCAAFHSRSGGASVALSTAQRAAASGGAGCTTGFLYDARDPARPAVAVTAPLFRRARYHLRMMDGEFRFHFVPGLEPGATLTPGDWIEIPLGWFCGIDAGVPAFFRRLHDLRPFFRADHRRTRALPCSEAASLVEFNQNRFHWVEKDGFYANATETDGRNATQLLTGWCAGIITGYGLLGCGDTVSRQRAARMIDFCCAGGISSSGLFYGLYQDGKWEPGRAVSLGEDTTPWRHIRTSEDATLYLIRACRLESGRGSAHPGWITAVRSNLDSFTRLWERYGEFGMEVDRLTGEMTERGSAAGTLCIACLAEGSALLGERGYLETAAEAADSYYARFTAAGHTTGGPLDVLEAADSESCLMFPPSFLSVYDRTGEARFLRFAVEAADQLASWVLAFDGAFPKGSTLDRLGIQTIGGIIASAQNHHVGPGGATSSLSSLLGIYRASGEARFLRLLEDCASGLPQYLSRHDGYMDRMARGMMTEQINLADAMNHAQGEIWPISASWGATNILLTRVELPGVYVDPPRAQLAVFDHLDASVDWAAGVVEVSNPTAFTAGTSVQVEGAPQQEITLAPGERVIVKLQGRS